MTEIMSGNHKLFEIFYVHKEHNSSENYSTRTKFKGDLRILITHLYSEFQLKMSMYNSDNERKLKIIVLSRRGMTLLKII